ncbi:MAG: T9SS type A sorting domain-containing protein [Bacteroidales bacterium]|nr:T9SS type A sorting domain-containing protein [Bacteroidales bacterium]
MKILNFVLKKFVFPGVLLVLHSTLFGQLSVKGTPFGLIPEMQARLNSPVYMQMKEVDVNALIEEDKILDTLPSRPYRFGENLYVNLNPKNSGVRDTLDDGSRLWRLGIVSKGAVSINLAFDRYLLPKGATLFVYTPDGKDVIGAFTDLNNQDDGYFATTLVNGDKIIIEYYEPYWVDFPGELNLWRVTHGYRGPGALLQKGFGSSGWCNVNVACPEGQCWDHHIRSVGMLVVGGNGFCSGFLINNTMNNAIPYFLSADHCYENPSTVVFWFNWQSPTCQNPTQVPPHDAMSGAVTKARYNVSDFWLLRLNQSIPGNYNVYYSGWNRTNQQTIVGTFVGIHHPSADIKKISWTADTVTRTNDYWGNTSGTCYWRTETFNLGTIENGSSGSPLYDPLGYAIGQLSHAFVGCATRGPAWYGRIGASWTGGWTNATRLSNWLDPDNTYIVSMHGFDPNMNITGPPIVCTSNSTFTLTSLPPGASATWSFSPGNLVTPPSGSSTSAIFRGASCSSIGEGTLTFTINRPGCFPLQMTKRNIIVNGPDYSDVELDVLYSDGQPAPKNGQWLLCPYTIYHIYLMNNSSCSTSNYSWTIPSGWTLNYQYQNMISINTNASPGGNVIVKAQTCCQDCGSDVTIHSAYLGEYWDCEFGLFTLYPNPANNYVDIDINRGKIVAEDLILNGEYILTITDINGMVKYTDKFRGLPYRINAGSLPNGMYIINIIHGENTFSTRIIIEH